MSLRVGHSHQARVQGQIKLARLLELPEHAVERRVQELERDTLFCRLVAMGVVAVESDARARVAAHALGARGLPVSNGEGIAELFNGRNDLAKLIARMGKELFLEYFLNDSTFTDQERAQKCGVSHDQARRLRELIDRLYIQEEFQSPPAAAPAKVYSVVAGMAVSDGKPALSFFHRDLWKGRYRINDQKRLCLADSLTPREARRMETLLNELSLIERRKSTLLRVLETVMEAQADYLLCGDPAKLRPLTQRMVAQKTEAHSSVINRLISNKSVELPWGLQAPLRAFMPSSKTLLRERLRELALENPRLSDEALRLELIGRHAAKLSRRSVAQYRKDLGLGGRGRRAPTAERPPKP